MQVYDFQGYVLKYNATMSTFNLIVFKYKYYCYLLQVIYKAKQPVTPDQQVKKYK